MAWGKTPKTAPGAVQAPTHRDALEPVAVVRARARGRVLHAGALLVLALCAVGGQGARLGLAPDERVLAEMEQRRFGDLEVQGFRGRILDNSGQTLAMSVASGALNASPHALAQARVDHEALADQLAMLLPVDAAELREALKPSDKKYVRVAREVPPAVEERVRELARGHDGLYYVPSFRRLYPEGSLGAQLLGFVDAERDGKAGLEREFEEDLAGALVTGLDAYGRRSNFERQALDGLDGADVHLTMDRGLQRLTEDALDEVIRRHKPISASAVLVEVGTGRVLAMANAPRFNPNLRLASEMVWERNRAVTDAIEPASVFKPFTLAAALEAGVVNEHTIMETSSPHKVADRFIHDDHPHARITPLEMVKYSSNVGAAQLAELMGPDVMYPAFEAFGFGQRTGLRVPGERAGKLRPRGGGPVELATISFGQGATATPLQLAVATATLANGGIYNTPFLVERVTNARGSDTVRRAPDPGRSVVSRKTAALVCRSMAMVLEDGGTGERARVPGYSAGGKTGTAQKPKNGGYSKTGRYATFIGFAPFDHPELAMAVFVDEPTVGSRYGGVVAGPAFARVMKGALERRGVPYDRPETLPKDERAAFVQVADVTQDVGDGVAAAAPAEAGELSLWRDGEVWRVPDLSGRSLRDALATLEGSHATVSVQGLGLVTAQDPPPGSALALGEKVRLTLCDGPCDAPVLAGSDASER